MMTTTVLTAAILNATNMVFISPDNEPRQRVVQATVTGTGALTGTVDVSVSLDGGKSWATAGTLALSGSGVDSKMIVITCDNLWVRLSVTALTGTGAAVAAFIS